VTSDDLTRELAERLGKIVGRDLRFLGKLLTRLQALGFPPSDPMVLAATRAHSGMHALNVHVHYASCNSGVGRREK
jgi:hypothetical protein